jgi:tRNA U38,U39,U40 pseudouridine synthase TruA
MAALCLPSGILAARDRSLAGRTAGAQGLYLVEVLYDGADGEDDGTAADGEAAGGGMECVPD